MIAIDMNHVPPQARQIVDDVELRAQEAKHLHVPRTCKWGHAAFEPVQVGEERLSPAAAAIHAEMERS